MVLNGEAADERRTAIVTGASGGIGKQICLALAKQGFALGVAYHSSPDSANDTVEACRALGVPALALQADLSAPHGMITLVTQFLDEYPRWDVLVNNAGVVTIKSLSNTSNEEYDRIFTVNTRTLFDSIRLAEQHMVDGGRIVTISSLITKLRLPESGVYAASKAAAETLTAVAAKELGARRITVNSVVPGYVETPMLEWVAPEDQVRKIAHRTPLARIGRPEDIANAVTWLVSDEASWVTGTSITVDGGYGA